MNDDDVQKAALGLLNLSPTNTTFNFPFSGVREGGVGAGRIGSEDREREREREREGQKERDRETTTSTIPLKRKRPHQPPQQSQTTTATPPPPTSTTTEESTLVDTSEIQCICGFTNDDGWSIGCDGCGRWCHGLCFGIDEKDKENLPDRWWCWVCEPREVDRARAVEVQKSRLGLNLASLDITNGFGLHQRRKTSPGLDRRSRKPNSAIEGSKRKRRMSVATSPVIPTVPISLPHTHEDEPIQIDIEDTFIDIEKEGDVIPNPSTLQHLNLHRSWRGVTAISSPPPSSPPVVVHPLPTPPVLPPSFALHTSTPIPREAFITTYPSVITPSAAYLADPLNAYAHLGMPKPFVHLMGPPLDVALDARKAGGKGRWVRSGCRPNAVLRPFICRSKGKGKQKEKEDGRSSTSPDEDGKQDEERLSFAIFATRDLRADEEIILGWEWDDGNVVHQLPSLISQPNNFPPHQLHHFKQQMGHILHSLGSTFTTCACGSRASDCAVRRMREFVNSSPRSSSPQAHSAEPSTPAPEEVDLGPLIGKKRGFRTRERIPGSGGVGGVEMVVDEDEAESSSSKSAEASSSRARLGSAESSFRTRTAECSFGSGSSSARRHSEPGFFYGHHRHPSMPYSPYPMGLTSPYPAPPSPYSPYPLTPGSYPWSPIPPSHSYPYPYPPPFSNGYGYPPPLPLFHQAPPRTDVWGHKPQPSRKGKERAIDEDMQVDIENDKQAPQELQEDIMPPKMRKKRIQKEAEAFTSGMDMDVDVGMPPPPPPNSQPHRHREQTERRQNGSTSVHVRSRSHKVLQPSSVPPDSPLPPRSSTRTHLPPETPSASFSKLSLLSPITPVPQAASAFSPLALLASAAEQKGYFSSKPRQEERKESPMHEWAPLGNRRSVSAEGVGEMIKGSERAQTSSPTLLTAGVGKELSPVPTGVKSTRSVSPAAVTKLGTDKPYSPVPTRLNGAYRRSTTPAPTPAITFLTSLERHHSPTPTPTLQSPTPARSPTAPPNDTHAISSAISPASERSPSPVPPPGVLSPSPEPTPRSPTPPRSPLPHTNANGAASAPPPATSALHSSRSPTYTPPPVSPRSPELSYPDDVEITKEVKQELMDIDDAQHLSSPLTEMIDIQEEEEVRPSPLSPEPEPEEERSSPLSPPPMDVDIAGEGGVQEKEDVMVVDDLETSKTPLVDGVPTSALAESTLPVPEAIPESAPTAVSTSTATPEPPPPAPASKHTPVPAVNTLTPPPAVESTPSPQPTIPATKVKLSLKDFAARRKQQQQKEAAEAAQQQQEEEARAREAKEAEEARLREEVQLKEEAKLREQERLAKEKADARRKEEERLKEEARAREETRLREEAKAREEARLKERKKLESILTAATATPPTTTPTTPMQMVLSSSNISSQPGAPTPLLDAPSSSVAPVVAKTESPPAITSSPSSTVSATAPSSSAPPLPSSISTLTTTTRSPPPRTPSPTIASSSLAPEQVSPRPPQTAASSSAPPVSPSSPASAPKLNGTTTPHATTTAAARAPSPTQEDGEIDETPASTPTPTPTPTPKQPCRLPVKSQPPPVIPLSSEIRTPPTQPRSFTTGREPPKGPRALMGNSSSGGYRRWDRERDREAGRDRDRDWDRDRARRRDWR